MMHLDSNNNAFLAKQAKFITLNSYDKKLNKIDRLHQEFIKEIEGVNPTLIVRTTSMKTAHSESVDFVDVIPERWEISLN